MDVAIQTDHRKHPSETTLVGNREFNQLIQRQPDTYINQCAKLHREMYEVGQKHDNSEISDFQLAHLRFYVAEQNRRILKYGACGRKTKLQTLFNG